MLFIRRNNLLAALAIAMLCLWASTLGAFAGPIGSRAGVSERVRRSASIQESSSTLASKSQHQHQQQTMNEQEYKSWLSNMIAQAQSDKSLEKNLIKMLMSESFRSNLANSGQLPADSASSSPGVSPNDISLANLAESPSAWQQKASDNQGVDFEVLPLSRALANLIDAAANGNPSAAQQLMLEPADGGDSSGDRYAAAKRQVKLCSFSAISCIKNPYRRVTA